MRRIELEKDIAIAESQLNLLRRQVERHETECTNAYKLLGEKGITDLPAAIALLEARIAEGESIVARDTSILIQAIEGTIKSLHG